MQVSATELLEEINNTGASEVEELSCRGLYHIAQQIRLNIFY